jgi:DNA-binding response OmpR family regulator
MPPQKTILLVDEVELSDSLRLVLEKNGYPVLEHFRDRPDAPPIIMITANEGSRHKAYAEWLGAYYIRKPFTRDRLLEGVERVLKTAAKEQLEGAS